MCLQFGTFEYLRSDFRRDAGQRFSRVEKEMPSFVGCSPSGAHLVCARLQINSLRKTNELAGRVSECFNIAHHSIIFNFDPNKPKSQVEDFFKNLHDREKFGVFQIQLTTKSIRHLSNPIPRNWWCSVEIGHLASSRFKIACILLCSSGPKRFSLRASNATVS